MRVDTTVDRVVFREHYADPRSLAVYRMLYASLVLALAFPRHLWIANFPDAFFNPPFGPASLFTGFPPPWLLVAANAVGVVAAAALLIGYRTQLAANVVALALLFTNVWAYALGKINHDILLIAIPLVLQFSGWGDALAVSAPRGPPRPERANAWPVALLVLLIGFAMVTAAWAKASSGWLDPGAQAVRGHILANYVTNGRAAWMADIALSANLPVAWKALDYGTVTLEGVFLVAVVSRRAIRFVASVAALFHLGIAITMEIAYWPNLLAYGVVCDWRALERFAPLRRLGTAIARPAARWPLPAVGVLSAATALAYLALTDILAPDASEAAGVVLCALAAAIGVVHLGREGARAVQGSPPTSSPPDVVLFDGFCGLCNWWVDFILKRDRRGRYRFAALQSPAGQAVLARANLPGDFIDSLVVVDADGHHIKSAGVLRVVQRLGLPYNVLSVGVLVPRPVRDWLYDFVAERRFRWFGRRDACRLPTPEERSRFL